MRIAISGTHAVGKSTLITDLQQELPTHLIVDEPYYELLDEGHIFADPTAVEDFEVQLERSIARVSSDRVADILFDRCPADFLAYLSALDARDVVRDWLAAAADSLHSLDLIVFVPIEKPDRFAEDAATTSLRRRVDVLLREILLEDSLGFDLRVVSVQGSPAARARQVINAVKDRGFELGSDAV